MLTIIELSNLIGKHENTVRYWLLHDKHFVELFWKKQPVRFYNMLGRSYMKDSYVCDEADVVRIVEYLQSKKQYKKPNAGWTDIAKHCYERKMKCKGCEFDRYCSTFTYPPLKKKVLENIAEYGVPKNENT